LQSLGQEKTTEMKDIEAEYSAEIAKLEGNISEQKQMAEKEILPVTELKAESDVIEKMKSHINEFRRMESLKGEMDGLKAQSNAYTEKIEKARNLPGDILKSVSLPIEGLTIENSIPMINGRPINNLSDGEKLALCVDVAVQKIKDGGLNILLIDGIEKWDEQTRIIVLKKLKTMGITHILTQTTDDEDLTVVEL